MTKKQLIDFVELAHGQALGTFGPMRYIAPFVLGFMIYFGNVLGVIGMIILWVWAVIAYGETKIKLALFRASVEAGKLDYLDEEVK